MWNFTRCKACRSFSVVNGCSEGREFIHNLKQGYYKQISVLTGAGLSTNAGIPDYRSPDTGLYSILEKEYGMKSPTDIFQLSIFYRNPQLFYGYLKKINFDMFHPTLSHYFIGFLETKGILCVNFTQNIDGLELRAGISREKLVTAHGDVTRAHCPSCDKEYDIEELKRKAMNDQIMYCDTCPDVPIKPRIVFFGEMLPDEFHEKSSLLSEKSDCGLIIGTSLQVAPFNSLPILFPTITQLVVINNEPLDHIPRISASSLYYKGNCDSIVQEIIKECEWEKDFNDFRASIDS
ncbi:unnamed protein product [Moneuplotes crassus]|uniref:Deacetylase sirtuin-type domain-containing protein n=1 Tax=Euplotes crassus TaxID=5936 RepID=A0AAD1XQW5_EUPCR|nr:unnamed protein product [Moneuplotes crassus]